MVIATLYSLPLLERRGNLKAIQQTPAHRHITGVYAAVSGPVLAPIRTPESCGAFGGSDVRELSGQRDVTSQIDVHPAAKTPNERTETIRIALVAFQPRVLPPDSRNRVGLDSPVKRIESQIDRIGN